MPACSAADHETGARPCGQHETVKAEGNSTRPGPGGEEIGDCFGSRPGGSRPGGSRPGAELLMPRCATRRGVGRWVTEKPFLRHDGTGTGSRIPGALRLRAGGSMPGPAGARSPSYAITISANQATCSASSATLSAGNMRAQARSTPKGNSRGSLCGRSSDRRRIFERDSPRRKNGKCGIQPAHQSWFTDVFRARPLRCTIHWYPNFTPVRVKT
jgi:hypothetical protein